VVDGRCRFDFEFAADLADGCVEVERQRLAGRLEFAADVRRLRLRLGPERLPIRRQPSGDGLTSPSPGEE
jgi:hypothetical protein